MTTRSRVCFSSLMFAALLALAPPAAQADAGSRHHARAWREAPQASLQAQAVAEVAHDTVRITLAAELADASRQVVSDRLAGALAHALEATRDQQLVKVTSGQYRVWPMNDREGQVSNWRGLGELHLESGDFDAASRLAATLGSDMAITSVVFFVSDRERAAQEAALLEQAARAFQDRARALARAMGYEGYRLRSVDLGGSGARFNANMRSMQPQMALMAAADSVPLEGGTETITVSVQGSVWLVRDASARSRQ
ncbi:MAG: SIMPL domain-containing protein [Castellaniella sp.]